MQQTLRLSWSNVRLLGRSERMPQSYNTLVVFILRAFPYRRYPSEDVPTHICRPSMPLGRCSNPYLQTEYAPRKMFQTPFADRICPSEDVPTPICRPNMPLGRCSNPHLQTKYAHRKMFQPPFADQICLSEDVTILVYRTK
jgi:hypothetical protein